MNRADQNVTNMQNAIQLLDQHAANGEPIFVDYQSSLLLGHYLCRQRPITRSWVASGFDQFECQGHRVISLHYRDWVFTSASFSPRFGEMVQTYGVPAGTRVWIFQAGWGADLARQLPTIYPEFRDLPVNAFGRDISVFELTAGQPMPAAKPDSTGTHGNGDRTN